VVGITHVTLGDEREKNGVFWDYTRQVIESLPEHQGYLGHKLRKKLLADEAWTMTVWADEDALDQFVRGSVHVMAMGNGLPAVKSARFVRLILPRTQTPLDWDTAEQMMSEKGRKLY
jgi:heme-degrading monooxygenase HmoA